MDILTELTAAGCGAFPCLFVLPFAALVGVFIYLGFRNARLRREACLRLATELGFQYYETDPWNLAQRYGTLSLFSSGHSRKASNVFTGTLDARPVVLCDYQYETGSGKDETTHRFQAAVLELPILAPRLEVRRESVLDRIAEWVGHQDLHFESEEFSRRYHVKCTVPKFAYDILHERLIAYLLGLGDMPHIEMCGELLLLYCDGAGDVAKFRRLLDVGQHVIGSIPGYVVTERRAAATQGGRPPA
jgi:hypothetical protein